MKDAGVGKTVSSITENDMQVAFTESSLNLLKREEDFVKLPSQVLLVGLESEVAILPDQGSEKIEETRDKILGQLLPEVGGSVELGAAQIEFHTSPIDLASTSGFTQLLSVYQDNFKNVLDTARKFGCRIIRSGTNPFLPIINTPRTSKEKYRLVPDYYNQNRPEHVDTIIGQGANKINIGYAEIVSLFQAFQINWQADSFADGIDKLNRSLMIGPYLLALSANSRYLNFQDTGLADLRMRAWELSHATDGYAPIIMDTLLQDLRSDAWQKSFDLRSASNKLQRIGLPERYFQDVPDYLFNHVGRFPFILKNIEAALQIGIGMTWLDTRLKFIENSVVVELRILPTQSAVGIELQLMLWYLGRLFYSQFNNEPLMEHSLVKDNRQRIINHGLVTDLWLFNQGGVKLVSAGEVLSVETKRAIQGLEILGLDQYFDRQYFNEILIKGCPSQQLAKSLNYAEIISAPEMLKAMELCGQIT